MEKSVARLVAHYREGALQNQLTALLPVSITSYKVHVVITSNLFWSQRHESILGPLACDQRTYTSTGSDVSLIIQAPAGSGKTDQRYLRLLVTVPRCDMVLAVTF